MDNITYDVRIWKTEIYKGAKVTTYKVRWKTGTEKWKESFRHSAQADSFRSSLLTAARRGEARRHHRPPRLLGSGRQRHDLV